MYCWQHVFLLIISFSLYCIQTQLKLYNNAAVRYPYYCEMQTKNLNHKTKENHQCCDGCLYMWESPVVGYLVFGVLLHDVLLRVGHHGGELRQHRVVRLLSRLLHTWHWNMQPCTWNNMTPPFMVYIYTFIYFIFILKGLYKSITLEFASYILIWKFLKIFFTKYLITYLFGGMQ